MIRSLRVLALAAAVLSFASVGLAPQAAMAADVSITAANVVSGSPSRIDRSALAGETVTAGMAVYKAAATGKWMKADSDSATAEVRQAEGIALNGASLNQPLAVQTGGQITIGGTLTAGAPYYLSNTAGGIMPAADLSTGEYVDLVCLALSASLCDLQFVYTAVVTG